MQPPGGSNQPNVTVSSTKTRSHTLWCLSNDKRITQVSIGVHLNYTLSNTLNYNTVDTLASGSTIVYATVLPFLILVILIAVMIFVLVLAWVLCRRAKQDKGRGHEDSMER